MERSTPASPPRYTLCSDPFTVEHATRVLAQSPVLIIDCEGRNLGGCDGVLSLMCIGTERAEHIFVFDVLALKPFVACLRPLFEVLRDPATKKVMWDCRNDVLEILGEYDVVLQGVVDLQLAEILSRTAVRKEKDWNRVGRLAGRGRRLPMRVVKKNPELFAGVHSLQGMDSCIRQAKLATPGKDPQVVEMHKSEGSAIWLERPLPARLLAYAAHDIELIGALHAHFRAAGWLTPAGAAALVAPSMRYAQSLCEQGRVVADGVFGPCALLPLDVLVEPRGVRLPCGGCRRMLSLFCFSVSRRHGDPRVHIRSDICRVCQIKLLIKEVDRPISWVTVCARDTLSL